MRTFRVQTLGCKVNQYEGEQIAALLRRRGLVPAEGEAADLRIVHTCAVTCEAAGKSRQHVRRATRRPPTGDAAKRIIVSGCWATADRAAAGRLDGVDAVIGHHEPVAETLHAILDRWLGPETPQNTPVREAGEEGWSGDPADPRTTRVTTSHALPVVKQNPAPATLGPAGRSGARALPLLDGHSTDRARAFLKVQDGCDAHCTYCIIPRLRPRLWSKPIDDAVAEATALVNAGHREIVLTGIFLGAYGHETALRRRQRDRTSRLGELARALCTRVPGLKRLRFSSLEPLDLTDELIAVLRDLPQVVPHFHLPLQSGSDALLRKMNRQYTRDDYLRMLDRVHAAFDRPALTTDVICGFPGETDGQFERTLEIIDRAGFIHIHAFPFSPRPGTAAARWTEQFIPGAVANERIAVLRERALDHSERFRRHFIGRTVDVLVERADEDAAELGLRRGRCERYFDVHFESASARWGEVVPVRIDRITRTRTFGTVADPRSRA